MEAHVNNELRYLLDGPVAGGRIVHVIISDECLKRCGADPAALAAVAFGDDRGVDRDVGRLDPDDNGGFSVLTQTRRHVDRSCSEWTPTLAGYVSSGAAASVVTLRPKGHPAAFPYVNPDGGGLFVTLPVSCDAEGRVDPFDVVTVRVPCCRPFPGEPCSRAADFPRYVDVSFAYDELTSPGTRYGADGGRVPLLCAQFAAYVARRSHLFPAADAAKSIVDKMKAVADPPGLPYPTPLDVDAVLSTPVGFDETASATTAGEGKDAIAYGSGDPEVEKLLAKAAEAVAAAMPAGAISTGGLQDLSMAALGGGRGRRGGLVARRGRLAAERSRARVGRVVSGLKQGAEAYADERVLASARGERPVTPAPMLGLEPSGFGRFAGGTAHARAVVERARFPPTAASALEDVLIFDGSDSGPESMVDLLDAAAVLLAGGDSLADAWRRRPVSLVRRKHMGCGGDFFVVAYAGSSALGGRAPKFSGATRVDSAANALAEACAEAGVDSPARLPPAVRRRIETAYPNVRLALEVAVEDRRRGPAPRSGTDGATALAAPFSVSAELEIHTRFAKACHRAVALALSAAVRSEPQLRQAVSYDTAPRDERYVDVVAARAPALLTAVTAAIGAELGCAFRYGSLAAATLALIASTHATPYARDCRYEWFGTGRPADDISGGYAASANEIASTGTVARTGRGFGTGRRLCGDENAPAEELLFVFDYYSSAGECVKVSARPIPVIVDAGVLLPEYGEGPADGSEAPRGYQSASSTATCEPCRFPAWFAALPRERECERFLPGQSYAYVCVGYDNRLRVLVVFPGGYVLRGAAAEYFDWAPDATKAIAERFFVNRTAELHVLGRR